jgi:adenosylcobyric acid synthase
VLNLACVMNSIPGRGGHEHGKAGKTFQVYREVCMKARSLMVLGTASHVGKSLLTAALCRIFAQQGYRVSPFKAQNMSLNSAATVEGLEIGRAQALQAEAAGIPASVHMNPILIKPTSDRSSQIIVRGRVWGRLSAAEYHKNRTRELLPIIKESYEILAAENDLIILEGAGSPAEINLREHDIVNMRMAKLAQANCLLVGDIDRGGVFASLIGTFELLEPDERELIRGFIINKFRGDIDLLKPGIRMIEDRLNIPCMGVVPYLKGLTLEEEDSVGLQDLPTEQWRDEMSTERRLRIAVVCFPYISNFTDFDALHAEPSISIKFCKTADELQLADIIILPGTKQTIDDMGWLFGNGFADKIVTHASLGGLIVGICGGMQMLGMEIVDPDGMETQGTASGLGLLAINTTMRREKVTMAATAELKCTELFGNAVSSAKIQGYEIHLGETHYLPNAEPFTLLSRASSPETLLNDGCVSIDGRTIGTYLHGLFDEDAFRHEFLRTARAACGLAPAGKLSYWKSERERQWRQLTEEVTKALDMETICGWLEFRSLVVSTKVSA